jgi:hypothetical protein
MSNVNIEEGQHVLPSCLFGGQLELGGKMLQSDIVGPHHHVLGAMQSLQILEQYTTTQISFSFFGHLLFTLLIFFCI